MRVLKQKMRLGDYVPFGADDIRPRAPMRVCWLNVKYLNGDSLKGECGRARRGGSQGQGGRT